MSRQLELMWVLRAGFPQMGNLAEMTQHPFVGINGIQIPLSAIGEYRNAHRTRLNSFSDTFDSHHHSARRTASQYRLSPRESTTTNEAIEVRLEQVLVGELLLEQWRLHRSTVTGYQTLSRFASKDDASYGIDSKYLGSQIVLANVVGASSQRAAGAGGAENVINIAEGRYDLAHGLLMRKRIMEIRILIGPVTCLYGPKQVFHTIESRL